MYLLEEAELRNLFGEAFVAVMLQPDFWFCKIYKNESVATTVKQMPGVTATITVMDIQAFIAYRNNLPTDMVRVDIVNQKMRDLVDKARLCPQIVRLKVDEPRWGLMGVDLVSMAYIFETLPPEVQL